MPRYRNIPRDATCESLKLKYELSYDMCKKTLDAEAQGHKPRGKKPCAQLWLKMLSEQAHATIIIRQQKAFDALKDLGYKAEVNERETRQQ